MAHQLLGRAYSCLFSAQETLATHTVQLLKDYLAAPLKIAQMLQRWKALKLSDHHTHMYQYLTDIDPPSDSSQVLQFPGVNSKQKQTNYTTKEKAVEHHPFSSGCHASHKQDFSLGGPSNVRPSPYDRANDQNFEALLRMGRWPFTPRISSSAATAAAQGCYDHAFWSLHSGWSRESSKEASPGSRTLFTKLPRTSIPDRFVGKLKKVTVVGVGVVGMALVQTILEENLTEFVALVDVNPEKLHFEMLNIQHAATFMPTIKIVKHRDYKITENSDVCIFTTGARQEEEEDCLSRLRHVLEVFGKVICQLVKHSPNSIYLVQLGHVENLKDLAPPGAWSCLDSDFFLPMTIQ